MESEHDIERRVCLWVKNHNGQALKLRVDGRNGFPDRTIFLNGHVIFIEFKKPGGKLRAAQIKTIDFLRGEGAIVRVFDCYEKTIEFLEKYL